MFPFFECNLLHPGFPAFIGTMRNLVVYKKLLRYLLSVQVTFAGYSEAINLYPLYVTMTQPGSVLIGVSSIFIE